MNEWKEVWYVWDGVGNPPKNVKGVLFSDGALLFEDSPLNSYGLSWLNTYQYESEWKYITAYTLGEKRRRCRKILDGIHYYINDCPFCNGTGWEHKK